MRLNDDRRRQAGDSLEGVNILGENPAEDAVLVQEAEEVVRCWQMTAPSSAVEPGQQKRVKTRLNVRVGRYLPG